MKRQHVTISWVCQVIAAGILLQTLFFKFTGAPESVYIFSTLGAEPLGRYFVGTAELIAGILLLWPRKALWGALLTMGILIGAIGAHLTQLGIAIEYKGESDGGLLFGLALTALAAAAVVTWLQRQELFLILARVPQFEGNFVKFRGLMVREGPCSGGSLRRTGM